MRARRKFPRPEAMKEMNITPLVDVMLVLLIIFMMAAPVLAHQVTINVPQPSPIKSEAHDTVRVGIAADGALKWNDQALPREGFEAQLKLQLGAAPDTDLIFAAAPSAPYAVVVDLTATAHRLGVRQLAFADQ